MLDLFTESASDFLDGWFESAPIKAAYGFDGVVGNYASPYTPGSAYVLLHHVFGEVNGVKGAWGHAIGGMGSITQAMAKAFAPEVSVNCVAPGWIALEAEEIERGAGQAAHFAAKTPMQCNGSVDDVAQAVLFFAAGPHFITGQVLAVDGGLGL